MGDLWTFEALAALVSLTAMEIVLGIDNIVFLSIVAGKLPEAQRPRARRLGLSLALLLRLGLLGAIFWMTGLTSPLFHVLEHGVSGRDLVLLAGGLFLTAKATHEIFENIEPDPDHQGPQVKVTSFGGAIAQIIALDLVFSLDSVITAVGMARQIPVMIAAMLIAVAVMMAFAGRIGDFVNRHPSMKMLALSFLLLVGVMLTAEGIGQHIPRGYVYFAMAFSLLVEIINLRMQRNRSARRASTLPSGTPG